MTAHTVTVFQTTAAAMRIDRTDPRLRAVCADTEEAVLIRVAEGETP
jgi:hypothetical protein